MVDSKMSGKSEEREAFKKISLAGLYIRNLGANLLGFMIIAVLNVFTPLEFFRLFRRFLFLEGYWKVFFLFFPFVFCLLILVQYRVQSPIAKARVLISGGDDVPEKLAKTAKKRLLNLPFLVVGINLAVWITLPALVVSSFYLFMDTSLKTCLFLYFRTFMIGLIAAGLSFFLLEDYSRRRFIPLFFPNGRLATLPGTLKFPVRRKIGLLYRAGTLNPMILLVGTLFFIAWEARGAHIRVEDLVRDIFLFAIILCVIFVTIALRLNSFVQKSIQYPIGEMLRIVEKVKSGDFTQRIRVISNDEIGALGDAGNAMIAGLAERERIRDTFGKYVTPEIRDEILAGRIPLNGERRVATLLFSDLRGFSSYVEANDPEEVIRSMREYFSAMQKAIRMHQGLVLQYVGDEIEAVFGVPLSYEDHADRAVLAAFEMRKSLEALNGIRIKQGKTPFSHGIGIHTGLVLAGNTGSEDRLSYALIGDTVNLASRIEQLTKVFRCDILVSEETAKRLESSIQMKAENPQMVKGHSKPLSVYRVLG
ncbi:MAG: HAMP domain-containing protein [Desulfobacteraceae bacterium]|nr:HAMP domain-containing protein [Desulfobacteraceae bacterium]